MSRWRRLSTTIDALTGASAFLILSREVMLAHIHNRQAPDVFRGRSCRFSPFLVLSSSHGIYPGQGMSVAWSGFYRFTGWCFMWLSLQGPKEAGKQWQSLFGLCRSYLCLRDWKSDQLLRRIQVVLGVIVVQGILQTFNVAGLSPHGYSRGTLTMYRTYAFGERSDAGVDPVRRYFDFELR